MGSLDAKSQASPSQNSIISGSQLLAPKNSHNVSKNQKVLDSPSPTKHFVLDLNRRSRVLDDDSHNSGHESRRIIRTQTLSRLESTRMKGVRSKKALSKKNSKKGLARTFTFRNLVKSQSRKKGFLEEKFPLVLNSSNRLKEDLEAGKGNEEKFRLILPLKKRGKRKRVVGK